MTSSSSPDNQTAAKPRLWRLGKVVLAVLGMVALDLALTYLLFPYGSESQSVWYRYYQLGNEPIDTLICGTSYAMQCIHPTKLDRGLGSNSCSLASPQQTPTATLVAIEDAYNDHHISRAIIGISIESVTRQHSPMLYNLSYVTGEVQGRSLAHAAGTFSRVLLFDRQYRTNVDSLAALTPWAVWDVGLSAPAIKTNLEYRTTMTPLEAQRVRMHQFITERGFAPINESFCDRDEIATYARSANDSEYEMNEHVIEQYRKICRYCKAHDIKLYFVTTPWLDYLLLRYEREGGYALAIKPFVDAMTEEGATFLDFSLVKADYYRPSTSSYYNEQHLNLDGARRFTVRLAEVLAKHEQGVDVSSYFYPHSLSGWKEYLGTIKRIPVSAFTATPTDASIDLAMQSWAPSSMQIEYQVLLVHADESFEELRPYSTDTTFSYPTSGHGKVTLRVNARRVGSKRQAERHCTRTILY